MATPSDTLNTVISILTAAVSEDAEVMKEFTGQKQEIPLTKTVVSAGIKKTDVKYERDEEGITIQRRITVEALICAPKKSNSSHLFMLLDKMFSGIISAHGTRISLYGFSSDNIKYSSSLGALVLPLYITVGF